MKNKILVIFFLAIIISIIIYHFNKPLNNRVLLLGENIIFNNENIKKIDKYRIDTFTYDNITYIQLLENIKMNDYIIVKNKKVYLNQLISSTNYIIISSNNVEFDKKCNKDNYVIKNYSNNLNNKINELVSIIRKISSAKIIIIGNYCKNKDYYNEYYNKEVIFLNGNNLKNIDINDLILNYLEK